MKRYLFILAAVALTVTGLAQGNSQGKGKSKSKPEKETTVKLKSTHEANNVNGGTTKSSGSKFSKNQPAKVRAGFERDYPNAANVVWSKYRGNWTATYNSVWGRSTAVYHANGQRKDTRSNINRNQLPTGTVWDRIFKRDRVYVVGRIVQIESPSLGSEIFRIASQVAGASLHYFFYNRNGQQVKYDY